MLDNRSNTIQEPRPGEVLFGIQRIFARKISSEIFNTPDIFRNDWEPNVQLNLDVNGRALPQKYSYEITLDLQVNVIGQDKQNIFGCDISFVGIFTLGGLDSEQLDNMLHVFCPNVIFPYVRETIDSLLVRATLPPLMLAPLNFEARHEDKKRRQSQQFTPQDSVASTEEIAKLRAELAALKNKQSVSPIEEKPKNTGENEKLKAELEALKAVRDQQKKKPH